MFIPIAPPQPLPPGPGEPVTRAEFDALSRELAEAKADLNNVKMMVQGLGFAGTRKPAAITDPSHPMAFSHTFTPASEGTDR